jgi:hypothetical protein
LIFSIQNKKGGTKMTLPPMVSLARQRLPANAAQNHALLELGMVRRLHAGAGAQHHDSLRIARDALAES